jgi:hypothetical protein
MAAGIQRGEDARRAEGIWFVDATEVADWFASTRRSSEKIPASADW